MSFRRIVACLVLVALAGAASGPAKTRPLLGSNFYSNCRFSHTAPDDPIVYPGRPGLSHDHTFFGNTSTDASSNLTSLRTASTTCSPPSDKAAYWVPTLFQNGHEVRPSKAQAYYVVHGYRQMRAFPPGLRIVAGDQHASSPQGVQITYWNCGGRAAHTPQSTTIPAHCGVIKGHGLGFLPGHSKPSRIHWRTKSWLELHVLFPDCWDGKRLDSPDHQSHMAYSRGYVCPASHPVKVPLIRFSVRYPIDRSSGVELASGGQYSGHADFFNAWDQRALERLVDSCFHRRGCNPAVRY